MKPISKLVIGVGNPLRQDDGLGPYIAAEVETWGLPGIEVRTLFSLTPECASEIAEAEETILMDACQAPLETAWRRVGTPPATASLDHALTPEILLGLVQSIYGVQPRIWLLTVQGQSFGFREEITPFAMLEARKAMSMLQQKLLIGRSVSDFETPCTKSD